MIVAFEIRELCALVAHRKASMRGQSQLITYVLMFMCGTCTPCITSGGQRNLSVRWPCNSRYRPAWRLTARKMFYAARARLLLPWTSTAAVLSCVVSDSHHATTSRSDHSVTPTAAPIAPLRPPSQRTRLIFIHRPPHAVDTYKQPVP